MSVASNTMMCFIAVLDITLSMGMAAPKVLAMVPNCMRTTDTFTPEDIIPAIEGTNVEIFYGVASNSFMTTTSLLSAGREAYMA
ncbi:unnamed protein product [Camellia sinensis]